MLVLSRSEKQSIMIGNDVVVTVVGIRASEAQIAIQSSGNAKVSDEEGRPVMNGAPGAQIGAWRRKNESLVIGEEIVVTVYDIHNEKVRLGIQCPTHLPIHRKEVFDAINRENLRFDGS